MTAVLPETDDAVAIAELHDLLALQEKGFRAEPCPTLDVRRERLVALAAMMVMDRTATASARR